MFVANVPKLSKPIHKEANPRPSSTNHLFKSFLSHLRDERLRARRIAVIGHQQEGSRKAPLAAIERLIHEIRLSSCAPQCKELNQQIRKCILLMKDPA